MAEEQTRWDEITEMWSRDGRLYAIAGFLLGLMAFPLIGVLNETGEVQAFLENLAPEAVGIFVTVIFIYYLDRRRDTKNAEKALKRQLVDDAASISNEVAKNAVHQMRRKGWLEGENGLLKGADLVDANLHEASLIGANLQEASLRRSNLQKASLIDANLQGAHLSRANLNGAYLIDANLRRAGLFAASLHSVIFVNANLNGADLSFAELSGANLSLANLQYARLGSATLHGAKLENASLQGAKLAKARFDETTVLPDGSPYQNAETDMSRFTDPTHPDFWQPEWVKQQQEEQ